MADDLLGRISLERPEPTIKINIRMADREVKLKRMPEFGSTEGDFQALGTLRKWHNYLINIWIPSQPDADDLQRLFIEVNWNLGHWLAVVYNAGIKDEEFLEMLKASGMTDIDPDAGRIVDVAELAAKKSDEETPS